MTPETPHPALEAHLAGCAACRELLEHLATGGSDLAARARGLAAPTPAYPPGEFQDRVEPDRSESAGSGRPGDPRLVAADVPGRWGDYELIAELGRGGMGVVFKARQRSLQRDVAIKIILSGELASAAHLRRFQIEAEACARLDHPNIVPIYEVGEHQGRPFFAMKLIDGVSLRACGERFRPLPSGSADRSAGGGGRQRRAARLMAVIARAVHHAHERGVLHRDLKPANVLIDSRDDPHLTDFGLAKLAESESDLTLSRMVMGTPEYMSPEQAGGRSRTLTTASDVYALGAMLYELLTGQPPFAGEEPMQVLARVQQEEPRPPRALNGAIARDLEVICLKCLEKEPGSRFASAAALADELDRFGRGEPIRSRAVSVPERVWRWARRKPALAAAVLAVHVALGLGLGGVLWAWRQAVDGRERAVNATARAEGEFARAERENAQAQATATRLEIERAEFQFRGGSADKALANLARLLRQQPTNRVAAARLLSALSGRRFCVPLASLRPAPRSANAGNDRPAHPGIVRTGARRPGITAVNLSPDGRVIVVASLDGLARLWDVEAGQPLGEALRHEGGVLWAGFSADGSRVVTAAEDGAARVWAVPGGALVLATSPRAAAARHASFSPDGTEFAVAFDDRSAQRFDARTGEARGRPFLHDGPVYFAGFSPDGRALLTAHVSRDGPPAQLWSLAPDGAPTGPVNLRHHPRPEIRHAFPCFSPAGDVVAGFDGAVASLFPAADGGSRFPQPVRQVRQSDDLLAMAFSPDGRWFATGSLDASAQVWRAADGLPVGPRLAHLQAVNAVRFSCDGRMVLTGSSDQTVRLWRPETGELLTEPLRHSGPVLDVLAGSNRIVTASTVDGPWLWQLPALAPPSIAWTEKREVNRVQFSRNGERVLTLSLEGVSFSDARTGARLGPVRTPRRPREQWTDPRNDADPEPQRILDLDVSADERRLATALELGNVLLWEAFSDRPGSSRPTQRPFRDPASAGPWASPIRCVRFSPDGRFLLAGDDQGVVRLWEIERHALVFSAKAHARRINQIEFNREGTEFVTASWDHTARVWDARAGAPVTPPLPHAAEVIWARFHPNGTTVISASRDQTVALWSVPGGAQALPPLRHAHALSEVRPVDVSPDGRWLASVAGEALQLWDLATGRPLWSQSVPLALLQSVRFSRDGTRLLTAATDHCARVWDAATGHPVGEPMPHGGPVTDADFSPDGGRIVTGAGDGQVRIWPVVPLPGSPPGWLPDLAEALAGQRLSPNGVSEAVPVERLAALRQEILALPEAGFYGRWAVWFFAGQPDDPGLRPF